MRSKNTAIRYRNPFRDPFVTELIDDPVRYRQMFSERILIGETLEVFQRSNVILLGPQGSGKSMILNLVRYSVLAEYFRGDGSLPDPMASFEPFLGISINLQRANFHVFGRRSISRSVAHGQVDPEVDLICAADFLVHFLWGELLKAFEFLRSDKARHLLAWLRIKGNLLKEEEVFSEAARWDCWFGYYSSCSSLRELQMKCQGRLSTWRSFLSANIDSIPEDVWTTKVTLEEPMHQMGNFLGLLQGESALLPLFVVIDQYEVLPDLNPVYGSRLQRVVNSLIKARDPVAFYKIGARTHDWGRELRVWGADSRIEIHRDYSMVNLADLLMRGEDSSGWLFPELANDVAYRRLTGEGHPGHRRWIRELFGTYTPEKEAWAYVARGFKAQKFLKEIPLRLGNALMEELGPDASPLDVRFAAAWTIQRLQAGEDIEEIGKQLESRPWEWRWWRKERVEVGLLQVASIANQRKRYFGWTQVVNLAGFNITAFLLICREIWDCAAKLDDNPFGNMPLDPVVQTEGIFVASQKWRTRDRSERPGGSQRYAFLSRLGPAIRDALLGDLGVSNPGHSGFSLREPDLGVEGKGQKVGLFLDQAVNWAIFEERLHTSKRRESATRRKYYLHPLLSPAFGIPLKRVKEPLYVDVEEVYGWIFKDASISFGARARAHVGTRRKLGMRSHNSKGQLSIFDGGNDD